jgi:H+/Cl- antiporter ClcA
MDEPSAQVPAGVFAPSFILTVLLGLAAADTATPTQTCAVVVLLTTLFVPSQNSRSPTAMG